MTKDTKQANRVTPLLIILLAILVVVLLVFFATYGLQENLQTRSYSSTIAAVVSDQCECTCDGNLDNSGGDLDEVEPLCPIKTIGECTDTKYEFPNTTTQTTCEAKEGQACRGYGDLGILYEGDLRGCRLVAVPSSSPN